MPSLPFCRRLLTMLSALCCVAVIAGCEKDQSWKIGNSAPEISVFDLKDQTVKLSQFQGKPVVLRFWATGCQACVAGMPVLDNLSRSYRETEGLVVLAVNMGGSKPLVEAFAKGLKLSYPVFLDPALIAAQKYRVTAVPTTFFIDKKGVARSFAVGEITREKFDEAVGKLL